MSAWFLYKVKKGLLRTPMEMVINGNESLYKSNKSSVHSVGPLCVSIFYNKIYQ